MITLNKLNTVLKMLKLKPLFYLTKLLILSCLDNSVK
jgi:hypothetical protein